jgi:hypothetical protein
MDVDEKNYKRRQKARSPSRPTFFDYRGPARSTKHGDGWPRGFRIVVNSRGLSLGALIEIAQSFHAEFVASHAEEFAREWQERPTMIGTAMEPDELYTGWVITPEGKYQWRVNGQCDTERKTVEWPE